LTDQKQSGSENNSPLLQEEIEIELLNLIHKLETSHYDVDKVIKRVMEIDQMIFKSNQTNDVIFEYLAKLYGSLNMYKEAIRVFRTMMKSTTNEFSVRALEKYCNIRVKDCLLNYKSNFLSKKDAIFEISEVLKDLESLNRFGETAERWSLIGSGYKRLLILSDSSKIPEILSSTIEAYQKASELSGLEDPYPLTNWLQFLQVQNELEGKKGLKYSPLKARNALSDLLENFENSYSPKSSYWDIAGKANIMLTLMLIEGTADSHKRVSEAFQVLWQKAGNLGQKQTELEHFDCLIHALANQKKGIGLEKMLQEIRAELAGKM
jgi:hypothetical protein